MVTPATESVSVQRLRKPRRCSDDLRGRDGVDGDGLSNSHAVEQSVDDVGER